MLLLHRRRRLGLKQPLIRRDVLKAPQRHDAVLHLHQAGREQVCRSMADNVHLHLQVKPIDHGLSVNAVVIIVVLIAGDNL